MFKETIDYVLHKLQQGHEYDAMSLCSFKIFYPISKQLYLQDFIKVMNYCQTNNLLVYTLVPVSSLQNPHTYLSICGVRHQ